MNKLTLATAVTALAVAAASIAHAGVTLQGPQLTGIALQSLEPNQPAVIAVTLASGETIGLRRKATD